MIRKVTRYSAYFILAVMLVSAFAAYVSVKTNVPQKKLKKIVEQEISKSLNNQHVRMKALSGGVLDQIFMEDLEISDFLRCSKVEVNYDLVGTTRDKGDILANISSIVMNKPQITIVRNKKGHLNVLDLIAPPTGAEGGPLTLKGNIHLKNARVIYIDETNLYGTVLTENFHAELTGMNGILSFINNPLMKIKLDGQLKTKYQKTPVHFAGDVDLEKGFWLNLDINDLDLRILNKYILPDIAAIKKGRARSKLFIGSLDKPAKKGELPLDLKIDARVKKCEIQVNYPGIQPIKDVEGVFHLDRKGMRFRDVRLDFIQAPWVLEGSIDRYDLLRANITVSTPALNLKKLSGILPGVDNLALSGNARARVMITERIADPKIAIDLNLPAAGIAGQHITGFLGHLNYYRQKMSFTVDDAKYARGVLRGNGSLDFTAKKPRLYVESFYKDICLSEIMPAGPIVTGSVLGKIMIKGPLEDLSLWSKMYSDNAFIFGQKLGYAEINSSITPKKFIFSQNALNINNSAVYLDGEVDSAGNFYVRLNSKKLTLTDKYLPVSDGLAAESAGAGIAGVERNRATMALYCALTGKMNEEFIKEPWKNLQGELRVKLADGLLMDQKIEQAQASVTLKDQLFQIAPSWVVSDRSRLDVSGNIDLQQKVNLFIEGQEVSLASLGILKVFLPENLRTVRGIGNLSLKIYGDLSDRKKPIWENLVVESKLDLADFTLLEQPLDKLKSEFIWTGQELVIEKMEGGVGGSFFNLGGRIGLDQSIDLTIAENSVFHLEDFGILLHELGYIGGTSKISGTIKGFVTDPKIDISTELEDFTFNDLRVDKIKGSIAWQNQRLSFKGVNVQQVNDVYDINGVLNFSAEKGQDFNLRVNIPSGNMKVITGLLEDIWKEASRQTQKEQTSPTEEHQDQQPDKKISQLAVSLGDLDKSKVLPIYRYQRSYGTVLEVIEKLKKEVEMVQSPRALGLVSQVEGTISGQMDLSRINGQLSAQASLTLRDGALSSIKYKRMDISALTVRQGVRVAVKAVDGALAGGPFELINAQAVYGNDGWLRVDRFDMTVHGRTQKNVIRGDIPLEGVWNQVKRGEQLDLTVQLEKDSVGILAIFNQAIEEIKNKGRIYVHIGGTLEKPVFNGKQIILEDAQLVFNPNIAVISTPFNISKADITLENNKLTMNDLRVSWQGQDTQNKENRFRLHGSIEIKELTFINPDRVMLDINIAMRDTDLTVNLPKLYMGELELRDFSLKGPYIQPISEKAKQLFGVDISKEEEIGPKLAGEVTIYDGRIPIPERKEPTIKPGMLLGITANIGNDVFVNRANLIVGGNIVNNIIGNFDFEMRKTKKPIFLEGSLNTPAVEGEVILDRGSLSSFLKQFQLVEKDAKQIYFKDREKIKENSVSLTMVKREEGETRRKIQPSFHIVASTITEVPIESESATPSMEEKEFLVILEGPITDLSSISFAKYSVPEDSNSIPELEAEYQLISQDKAAIDYTQLQELYYAMMPSLIRDLPEILSEGLQSEKSQELLRKYTSTQADVWVHSALRPYEKEIARNVGLYDLKVRRNFGEDFNNIIGLSEDENGNGEDVDTDRVFGLDLVEELIADRFFITLNTNINKDIETENFILKVESYKLTVSLLKDFVLDDISMNFQNKIDIDSSVDNTFSVEANHKF
ncbi:hypothetical protein ACFL57_04650 [Candidatus Margulisiibacteriota bacterium]